jgi:succinyl-CoA synthetase beta subunit
MTKLYEAQGKEILKNVGISIPNGKLISNINEAKKVSDEIGFPVIVKIQTYVTGRKEMGGIRVAENNCQLEESCNKLLGMKVRNFIVQHLLIEQKLDIKNEYFAGIIIDDREKAPLLIFSSVGGTGIEQIARENPDKVFYHKINVLKGLKAFELIPKLKSVGIKGGALNKISSILVKLYKAMRKYDARSIEVNPLVITQDNKLYAADCHIVIDDYAVYRHKELGIEIAREFDRPPTELEKIAYSVEKNDYRGTFYFFQMAEGGGDEEQGNIIAFHGAGGGGSMMSMDAVAKVGYRIANFCDTSGNPPASKVYRAAKILLSQLGVLGYFASGSGVASQEQFHSARGFVKAFTEEGIDIPAVLRLGGNSEEIAIDILNKYLKSKGFKVEGYGKNDSPDLCMHRLISLINENKNRKHQVKKIEEIDLAECNYKFETITGSVNINQNKCLKCKTKGCVESCKPGILKIENDKPVLAIAPEDVKKGKCTECLACEIYCKFHEQDAIYIHLPIPGLAKYRNKLKSS